MMEQSSFIAPEEKLPEITLKVIVISILLSVVLAISNAYLALKVGLLLSASIPAAIISMGILRFFKHSNVLENNLIQTAASAGEAVAGGVAYTIPGLIIIHYWTGFNYWQSFFIALLGGILGVMFSIPLRRVLMTDKSLPFPEGRAIAEVLKISHHSVLGVKNIVYGGLVGAVLEFCQNNLKVLADSSQLWFKARNTLFGFGVGFSPAMIGAGYLIGFELTASIFFGAIISWLILIPLLSHVYPDLISGAGTANDLAHQLWGSKIRYIGIGSMLMAGLMTLSALLKPLVLSIKASVQAFRTYHHEKTILRTDFDLPMTYVLAISVVSIIALYFLYLTLFPVQELGLSSIWMHSIPYTVLLYTVIAGFLFCAVTAYFSGMVGVSASPGSSVIIAGLLIIAAFIFVLMHAHGYSMLSPQQIKACEAITIMCIGVITSMAAISNDNMQDLKVGYLIGSTPWKQQIMLLLGVLCASLIITPVMQMLYNVYGIAGVVPHAGMNVNASLPAPPAAVMATLSEAVFQQHVPWNMLIAGASIPVLVRVLNIFLNRKNKSLSILGVAMGVYFPLSISTPLFLGGLIAKWIKHPEHKQHNDTMLACGLIAGTALLDVILAIPISLLNNPNALSLNITISPLIPFILSVISLLILFMWFRRVS